MVVHRFAPGASLDELEDFETAVGAEELPAPFRALYTIANGSQFDDGLFGGWRWLSLDQVQEHYFELREIEADDPSETYDPETSLPLFYYEGDFLYIDLTNSNSPVYYRDHEAPTHQVVADCLASFLREYSRRVTSGLLVSTESNSAYGVHYDISPPNRAYWPPDFN